MTISFMLYLRNEARMPRLCAQCHLTAALKQLKAGSFDLVLLDEELPDGSGLALLLFIKAMACETAVIVMSGNSGEQMVGNAKQKGADGFIGKPFELREVRSAVESTMARKVRAA